MEEAFIEKYGNSKFGHDHGPIFLFQNIMREIKTLLGKMTWKVGSGPLSHYNLFFKIA